MERFHHSKGTSRFASVLLLIGIGSGIACAGQVPLSPSRRKPPASAAPAPPEAPAGPGLTPAPLEADGTVNLPGPLPSLLRMAGLSQQAKASDVLSLMAYNAFQIGYSGTTPSEYLVLLRRYVGQARELQAMAGSKNVIEVASCAEAGPLLKVLGYRLQKGCAGKQTVVETAVPERAFLTIDSGFPLVDLEESFQKGVPFSYSYSPTPVTVVFREADWLNLGAASGGSQGSILDVILNDPKVARLYYAMGNIDRQTRQYLRKGITLRTLLPVAPILDFYGSEITVRDGKVLVPGGAGAEPAWRTLVGAGAQNPSQFVLRLLTKDEGWMAAYFDALARVNFTQQQHLTQMPRMQRYYDGFRTAESKGNAGIGIFRNASELIVLDTRLRWDANGDPHVPGSVDQWRDFSHDRSQAAVFRDWRRRNLAPNTPEKIVAALMASSRDHSERGPLELYLTLCEIDRKRPADRQLRPATVARLTDRFATLGNWYMIFSEFPSLTDEAILRFLDAATELDQIRNQGLRANALGTFQANISLWQIVARQHQVPESRLDASWISVLKPFTHVGSPVQLFDAARESFQQILVGTGAAPDSSAKIIPDLLAGPVPNTLDGKRVHDRLAARIRTVLDDQQLASLDTLFQLSDGLSALAKTGGRAADNLLPLAKELRGFELPKPVFTDSERADWAPINYTQHHIELQVQTDLSKVIQSPATKVQIEAARGQLAPFLRDTLVGLNYAYYEPPGAQILHYDMRFVRAHDFLSMSVQGENRIWQAPVVVGAGISAGGGAYLMGSLTDLPYSLATAESDFIVPEHVQSLVWKEVVPALLTDAVTPRWWTVTPSQLHAVTLYQQAGEEILVAASKDAKVHANVTELLSHRVSPRRLETITETFVKDQKSTAWLSNLMPAEVFYLGEEYFKKFPDELAAIGPLCQALKDLAAKSPTDVLPETLSDSFGIQHPILAQSSSTELLNLPEFPLSSGVTSRLLGESLESPNLYWARLADELGYSPAMLHLLVPELTRRMAGKIFGSNTADTGALLRALRETGDEFRQGKVGALMVENFVRPQTQPTHVSEALQQQQEYQ